MLLLLSRPGAVAQVGQGGRLGVGDRWSGAVGVIAGAVVTFSGTTRDELALLTAIPGAIGKAGAEGCYAVALPDGRAFALKTDDGGALIV